MKPNTFSGTVTCSAGGGITASASGGLKAGAASSVTGKLTLFSAGSANETSISAHGTTAAMPIYCLLMPGLMVMF